MLGVTIPVNVEELGQYKVVVVPFWSGRKLIFEHNLTSENRTLLLERLVGDMACWAVHVPYREEQFAADLTALIIHNIKDIELGQVIDGVFVPCRELTVSA